MEMMVCKNFFIIQERSSISTIDFFPPLIQAGQLSVTGESMCTKYCLTA